MTSQSESSNPSRPPRLRRRGVGWTLRITPLGIVVLALFNLAILIGLVYVSTRVLQGSGQSWLASLGFASDTPSAVPTTTEIPATDTPTPKPSETPTTVPSATSTPVPASATPLPLSTLTLNQGLIVLALNEGGNTHLFAYQPQESGAGLPLPLTRLTSGPWDDITPVISPDGQTVAFTSSRSGYWDIYLLSLNNGDLTRLTDSLNYDAAPAWSPDNQWVVYETYLNDNLEIYIQSVADAQNVIRLTENQAADFSPVWSPAGRQIAFVSDRSGENDIWLADLDQAEEKRFQNISVTPNSADAHPAWSPDGTSIVWVGEQDGMHSLFVQDLSVSDDSGSPASNTSRTNLGSGDWPAWSPDGESILTVLEAPNRTYLTAYPTHYPGLVFPTLELPGPVNGISWGAVALSSSIQGVYQQAAEITPTALYIPSFTSVPDESSGRYQLIALYDVVAPNPYLHDATDESFQALRLQIGADSGWDILSSLENAYVPLTTPLEPGMGNDWLYTGRAFALDTSPMDSGWIAVVREDFGAETYWRVFIKALYQDGSAGIPLHDQPWNFEASSNGSTIAYEQGGQRMDSIPTGYWIDFTERAIAYGWQRQPALSNWTAFLPAALFNEFSYTEGLDWHSAMLQLYPPEAMVTPSPVIPPSRTPTATLRWYVSPTPTSTSTPRPTFTPYPVPTISVTPGG